MDTTQIQIEIAFCLAQATAFHAKAKALESFLKSQGENLPTNEASDYQPPPKMTPHEVEVFNVGASLEEGMPQTPSMAPPHTPRRRRSRQEGDPPPVLEAIQIVIGNASQASVNEVYAALNAKSWLPLGSQDPLNYIRHTLSKNKDIFLRSPSLRGTYYLSQTNPHRLNPSSIVKLSFQPEPTVEEPKKVMTSSPVVPYTAEEIAIADRVVNEVLELHARTDKRPSLT
jgi:hypothetical protein